MLWTSWWTWIYEIFLKEQITQKWKSADNVLILRPRCRVFLLVFFLSEQIWRNVTFIYLAHKWILGSEWVPSEWESKQLIRHHDWSTSNPNGSSQVNILWNEKLCVCKKQIHYFNFKPSLLARKNNYKIKLNNETIIYNNTSSSEKVQSLLSSNIKIHQYYWFCYITVLDCFHL